MIALVLQVKKLQAWRKLSVRQREVPANGAERDSCNTHRVRAGEAGQASHSATIAFLHS